MDARLTPLFATLRLQTQLYLNCLEGVGAEQAVRRPASHLNHISFVALHLLDSRHVLAELLREVTRNPYRALLEDARGIDDVRWFPTLDQLRTEWASVSQVVTVRFGRISAAELDRARPADFPVVRIGQDRVLDAIAFLLHHEGYHVGQMALIRRMIGLPAMSYRGASAAASLPLPNPS